jgi:DNA-binding transcriptional LysR family regulator
LIREPSLRSDFQLWPSTRKASAKLQASCWSSLIIPVAEELGFSPAAERLNVSQPPLSRQIRGLESELNVKLINRNRHEAKLMRVGRALLVRARELIGEAKLLRKHADMEGSFYEELLGRL